MDLDLIANLAYISLFAPLCGAVFAAMLGCVKKNLLAGFIPSILVFASFISSAILFIFIYMENAKISLDFLEWIAMGDFYVRFGFVVDRISVSMMVVVGLVSSVVHIYSIGYMSKDIGFNRYFSFLSAFVFSMMLLVMSDNFLGLFAGWEGVGLCSYLLIGFWYQRDSANFASIEAFVMNRIADLALIIGIFMIAYVFGSLKYSEVFFAIESNSISNTALIWIASLLFIGAMGKSAQFPFHTWLANAMEGPTPVSALIHAATMVTAGVYLLIRANPIYDAADIGIYIAYLGAFVAIFAASMATCNTDLKRIIAYSTLSQLGYMFVAAGLGAYLIALFHLITHAFFKALLFLGAGNVMHAMDDKLDITKMGRLKKPLQYTTFLMLIASIALAGIYPFAGFFSKDKILEVAFFSDHFYIWGILLFSAFLTAFYSFRLIMLVFFAPQKHTQMPNEAPAYMLVAMSVLGILSIIAGWGGFIEEFLSKELPFSITQDSSTHLSLIIGTMAIVLSGIILAIFKYHKGVDSRSNALSRLLANNYYIPQLYRLIFINPYIKLSQILFDKVEKNGIDSFVDSIAFRLSKLGKILSLIQNGNLSRMLKLVAFGLFALLVSVFAYMLWR